MPDSKEEFCKIISKYHPYLIECPCGARYGSGSRHIHVICHNPLCQRELDVIIHSTEEKGHNIVIKPERKESEND